LEFAVFPVLVLVLVLVLVGVLVFAVFAVFDLAATLRSVPDAATAVRAGTRVVANANTVTTRSNARRRPIPGAQSRLTGGS
jgi:uncharacterized protein (UPF0333 family)